jgi:DNA replication protein
MIAKHRHGSTGTVSLFFRKELTQFRDLEIQRTLPLIDDLAELKLTLHVFWLLNHQEGDLRYLRGDDLRGDERLIKSLRLHTELRNPEETLKDALERATARGQLIRVDVDSGAQGNGWEDWYFLNTVRGRQAVAQIRTGQLDGLQAVVADEARLKVQRPNIFVLYEQNIGMLTPLMADQLRDVEKTYPPEWVNEAFDIAVAANKRALRYILAILRRWESEGKDGSGLAERDTAESRRRKYAPDEFSDIAIG